MRQGGKAVVIGASISGLLAARVLADHYDAVTVVDRDVLPGSPLNRPGVPQDAHSHVLLARCPQILSELFPGFLDELRADGVPVWADGDLSKIDLSVGGHSLVRNGNLRYPQANAQYYPSRLILEYAVRQRVKSISNVTIFGGSEAVDLVATTDSKLITGVRVACRDGGGEATLPAELVVDAAGRGSRTPVFLERLGYGRPPQEELFVRISYASQLLRIPGDMLGTRVVGRVPVPGRPAGFVLVGNENNHWVLTLSALAGHEPPTAHAEILKFLEQVAPPDALAAVRAAQPVGEITRYRVPSNRWRRYDKMRRFPDGLVVVGDAMCSFNPIYAQGITIAALDAVVLRDCLRHRHHHLPRQFFRASAKNIAVAWRTAVGADLALPEVVGPRPASIRISNAYMELVLLAAQTDAVVAEQFLSVIGMVDSPACLLRPVILMRILKAAVGHHALRAKARPSFSKHFVTT